MVLSLASVRIILVEPAGARNVGSVARVMKNMGFDHLVLVNPQCDHLGEDAQQMAVHGRDILEAAEVVRSLPEGLADCCRAIATLGRPYAEATPEHPRSALPWLLEGSLLSNSPPSSTALIFGPEDRGLSNDELSHAHRFITIPSNPAYPSLNLAQAVGICCYELREIASSQELRQEPAKDLDNQSMSSLQIAPPLPDRSASIAELEGFYQHLESLLLAIGYLQPQTANSRMKKFRRLFNRAMPSSEEVTMVRGILSQMNWAIGQPLQDRSKPKL
jgi:tRNA/rRNA methyltransferase